MGTEQRGRKFYKSATFSSMWTVNADGYLEEWLDGCKTGFVSRERLDYYLEAGSVRFSHWEHYVIEEEWW